MPVRERVLLLTQATYTLGVSAVVVNESNEVLLLRNRFRYSRAWQLPGGFVSRGETLEGAISREIREEAGLEVQVVRQLFTHLARPQHIDVCFLCRITGGTFDLDQTEILEGRLFPLDELPPDLARDEAETIRRALDKS